MENSYKEKIAFDIIFGSILRDDNDNIFYNSRRLDATFLFPNNFDKSRLKELMSRSISDQHDYVYDIVKDNPIQKESLGFVY